ncbi:MAG: hypothetical protein ACI6PR_19405, partial [Pseudoalteromonas sp.]|uniref:hypothetical protein n=1 Tax=Pseudoalteromonas sp. TaxID=53249 RepID=UPI003850D6F2
LKTKHTAANSTIKDQHALNKNKIINTDKCSSQYYFYSNQIFRFTIGKDNNEKNSAEYFSS